jgi:hypothetical protein
MSLEVNGVESAPSASAAPAAQADARRPTVTGSLRRVRAGWTRVLELCTGLALLRWLGLGLLSLLGYRHEVTLSLQPSSLDLAGERRLLGMSLGQTRRVIPLGTVRRAALAAQSSTWALACAAVMLAFCAAVAGVLLVWGVRGRQPSWLVLAAVVLAVGFLLDAVAYLWVRRSARQGRVRVKIRTRHERFAISGATQRAADLLLDKLAVATVRD